MLKADLDQLVKTRKIWKEEKVTNEMNEELLGKITNLRKAKVTREE